MSPFQARRGRNNQVSTARFGRPIGPSPIDQGAISANGQVTAIAINPNNPKIIYIGTAWGGVWLTRDGGNTWTPIFDRAPSLGVGDPGALAIDPVNTNIVYVGTSSREGSQFSGEATQPSAGLFKSTDGGASWIRLGFRLSLGTAEQCEHPLQSAHHRRPRRSDQHSEPLPRLQRRPLCFDRRRLQLDPGRGPCRRRALAGAGHDLAGRRSHLVRGRQRGRRRSVHRRGAELACDPQCGNPSGRRRPRRRGNSAKLSWRSRPRPRPQAPPAFRCSTSRWSEPGARRLPSASSRARIRAVPGTLEPPGYWRQ